MSAAEVARHGRFLCHALLVEDGHERPGGPPVGRGGFAFETAMSRRDAEEVLNLYPRAMGCALKCELASTILHDGRLCRTSVLKLAGERISGGEILARWGSGRRMPAELHDERRFPRLGPTGWDRRSVEDLFAKEAGKRL